MARARSCGVAAFGIKYGVFCDICRFFHPHTHFRRSRPIHRARQTADACSRHARRDSALGVWNEHIARHKVEPIPRGCHSTFQRSPPLLPFRRGKGEWGKAELPASAPWLGISEPQCGHLIAPPHDPLALSCGGST